jgi:hypothetical protein
MTMPFIGGVGWVNNLTVDGGNPQTWKSAPR